MKRKLEESDSSPVKGNFNSYYNCDESLIAPRKLGIGEIYYPKRPIGHVGPELPVQYPEKWPEHIEKVLKKRGDKPVRLFADGVFDLCNYAHFRMLESVKKAFPNTYVMAGVNSDADVLRYKGRTVMTEAERIESIRHCKWVDEIIPCSPWVLSKEWLDEHDIDFVMHDDLPYPDTSGASGCGDVYAPIKKMKRFHPTQRTEGISTTDLILRIIKDYDAYVKRNLSRGVSAKEMNVGVAKQVQLKVGEFAGKTRDTVQTGFLSLFSPGSTIGSVIQRLKRGRSNGSSSGSTSEGLSSPEPTSDTKEEFEKSEEDE